MGKRIISRRRGSGTFTYRSPSHRHHGEVRLPDIEVKSEGTVEALVHAPGRSSPVARVRSDDGVVYRLLAQAGASTGDRVALGAGPLSRGSVLALAVIPDGTIVSNIEIQPNDGGKMIRAAGTSALVIAHTESAVTLQLPSGAFKRLHPNCRAQIGPVAGGGRGDKPFAKAGKKVHAYQSLAKAPYKVRGVAMNPVNHPFGGGAHQHVGRPSTVSSGTWPGAKVGRFGPRPKRKKRPGMMAGSGKS
jgi:large subunit ribosomal protein L2